MGLSWGARKFRVNQTFLIKSEFIFEIEAEVINAHIR